MVFINFGLGFQIFPQFRAVFGHVLRGCAGATLRDNPRVTQSVNRRVSLLDVDNKQILN